MCSFQILNDNPVDVSRSQSTSRTMALSMVQFGLYVSLGAMVDSEGDFRHVAVAGMPIDMKLGLASAGGG